MYAYISIPKLRKKLILYITNFLNFIFKIFLYNIYITIGDVRNCQNMNVYSKIILDNRKIIKKATKKKIIKKLKNYFLYKNETYTSDKILYFNEKYAQDKLKSIALTKDIYIPLDTPDEITFFYHNYRIIKMKKFQVQYSKYVINELNNLFEKSLDNWYASFYIIPNPYQTDRKYMNLGKRRLLSWQTFIKEH